MIAPLAGKHIVLGVTGSIACYKALDLASKLVQGGAIVDVVLSYGATRFVTPLAFQAITHRPVVTDGFDVDSEFGSDHVALAQRADLIVIAPTTVNCIAKLVVGLADDPLTTTVIGSSGPLLIAPAMDANMYEHPATQENLSKLRERGVMVAGPATGRLASGLIGTGRLLETADLLGHIAAVLGKHGDLAGRNIVISAGGTMEAIDPARVITNHSSGKMGYALAEAARDRGAAVILVTGPTSLPDPVLVQLVRVESAQDMCEAVLKHVEKIDALIMAAAVADYRPSNPASQKIKKQDDALNISLTKTVDILETVQGDFIKVGFSAESEDLVANSKAKVRNKGLDLIVANDITGPDSGFGVDTNKVTLIDRNLKVDELPLLTKYEVGHRVLDRIHALLSGQ